MATYNSQWEFCESWLWLILKDFTFLSPRFFFFFFSLFNMMSEVYGPASPNSHSCTKLVEVRIALACCGASEAAVTNELEALLQGDTDQDPLGELQYHVWDFQLPFTSDQVPILSTTHDCRPAFMCFNQFWVLYETRWCWFLDHSVTNCHLKITASLINCSGYRHHWAQLQCCAVACGWSHAGICLDSSISKRIGGTEVPHGGIKMYAKSLLRQLLRKVMFYSTVFLSHSPHSSTLTWVSMLVAGPHSLDVLHYSPACMSACKSGCNVSQARGT